VPQSAPAKTTAKLGAVKSNAKQLVSQDEDGDIEADLAMDGLRMADFGDLAEESGDEDSFLQSVSRDDDDEEEENEKNASEMFDGAPAKPQSKGNLKSGKSRPAGKPVTKRTPKPKSAPGMQKKSVRRKPSAKR